MQHRGADSILHRLRVGIAVCLFNSFPAQFLHTAFWVFVLGVFQFHYVAVLHVGIDFQHWAEEDVDIACLCVLFGNGAVEAVLCRHGKGEAVDKELTFLFVALGGVPFQAVGNVAEVGLPISIVGKGTSQFALLIAAKVEVSFVVGAQQIGIELFANHLVGDGELGLSFIRAVDGEHAEIVEQAHKVIGIGDADGGEAVFQISGNVSLAYQSLDDGSIVGKLLILADKHTQLFIINADIAFHHILWHFTIIIQIILDEVEHHV